MDLNSPRILDMLAEFENWHVNGYLFEMIFLIPGRPFKLGLVADDFAKN
jgi:hypothetical protein